MIRFTPKAGGYGAIRMDEDGEGDWVELEDVLRLLRLKPGKSLPKPLSDIYCCAECGNLFDSGDIPSETPSDSDDTLYCEECANECRNAAEESSPAYFNRYIAGDR